MPIAILSLQPNLGAAGSTIAVTLPPNNAWGFAFNLPGATYDVLFEELATWNAATAPGTINAYNIPLASFSVVDAGTIQVTVPALAAGSYMIAIPVFVNFTQDVVCATQPFEIVAAAAVATTGPPRPLVPKPIFRNRAAPRVLPNLGGLNLAAATHAGAAPSGPAGSSGGGTRYVNDADGRGYLYYDTDPSNPPATPDDVLPMRYVFEHEGDNVYVLSDIHLSIPGPQRIFERYDDLVSFFKWAAQDAQEALSGAGHIVIIGDLFDIWSVPIADPPADERLVEDHRLEQILAAAENGQLVQQLIAFMNAGPNHRVTYVVGNHDSPIRYAANKQKLIDAVNAKFQSHPRFHLSVDSAFDKTYGVYFEHGHQSGKENFGPNCFGKDMVEKWVTPSAFALKLDDVSISMFDGNHYFEFFGSLIECSASAPLTPSEVDKQLSQFFQALDDFAKLSVGKTIAEVLDTLLTLPINAVAGLAGALATIPTGLAPNPTALALKWSAQLAQLEKVQQLLAASFGVGEAADVRERAQDVLGDPITTGYVAAHIHDEDYQPYTIAPARPGDPQKPACFYVNTNTWVEQRRKRADAKNVAPLEKSYWAPLRPEDGPVYTFVRLSRKETIPDPVKVFAVAGGGAGHDPHNHVYYVHTYRWRIA